MTLATGTRSPGPTTLEAVRALIPALREAEPATDASGRVPDATFRALREAGVYRMVVPTALGGDAVPMQTFLDILEALGEGNGAAAWDVATSCWHSLVAMSLPAEGARRVWADGPDIAFAGGFAGAGQAIPVDGGYRVSGQWRFGSGSAEADWFLCGNLQVADEQSRGGAPPPRRYAMVPASHVEVRPTWDVIGLRGTGSHDFALTDVFVPEPLTGVQGATPSWTDTLFRLAPGSIINALHISAVATGIARRAVEALVELAQRKTAGPAAAPLRERVQTQEAVARAEGLIETGRAYRRAIVEDVWATAEAGQPITVQQRARVRLAGVTAAEQAVRAVDLVFSAAGTTSLQQTSPISHCFRDIRGVTQNANLLPTHYESIGRVLLGLESGSRSIG